MENNKPILILTASYGDGHLQVARSLKLSFERGGSGQVHIMDLMKEAHPIIDKITKALYTKSMLISQYGFDYYGWSYYITKNVKFHTGWSRFLNNLGHNKLRKTIKQMRPHVVIATFPFGAVPEICKQLGISSFTVVTDFSLHSRWIHPNIDKYYVASDELKEQLISKDIAHNRVEVSGIPVRKVFDELGKIESSTYLPPVNNHRKTILILAGAYGVLRSIDTIIDSLKKIDNSKIVIVCGRNCKLERRLKMKYDREPHVTIYGFIEHIHQLMAVSSCIVTKAGGLTLSEALSLQVPIFIYKPFAGQEKENAVFLSSKGAAFLSQEIEELAFQIERFLSRPNSAAETKRQMQLLYKKSAADFIAADILRSIKLQEKMFNFCW